MQHKWLILVLWQVSVTPRAIIAASSEGGDVYFKEFLKNVEHLVVQTEDAALRMTIQIYAGLADTMSPELRQAAEPLMDNYLEMVNHSLATNGSYAEKRMLLTHFRTYNRKIERLRSKLEPDMPVFQFQVISQDFYFFGRNITIFDNLYMHFMQEFQKASQTLWDNLSEEVVEYQQEMLELLDEISKETNLAEKDKLYDEFIEMFLFKSDKDRLETRELE